MKEPLETGAVKVLQALQQHGYQAYLVGGCVRDKMLQRPVKDYDIATSALPEQVQQVFRRTIPTGIQHGTVTVVMDANTYEVTTFRKEEAYEQFRRPTEVHYIDSLNEDLRRRDFTMNAMALDAEGKLIDPFGGMKDLEQGILRCVGEPKERFEEDALRMLRCLRFASEYALRIEKKTWDSLCELAMLLRHIAMERVRMELERMVNGADPSQAVHSLLESKLLTHTRAPLLLSQVQEWSAIGKLASAKSRWAYLYLMLEANPRETEEELKRLTFSNQQVKEVVAVISAKHTFLASLESSAGHETAAALLVEDLWKRTALQFGKEALSTLYSIWKVGRPSGITEEQLDLLMPHGNEWLQELKVTKLSELAITGNDLLIRLNRKGGPWVSAVLQHLLEQTALAAIPNEPQRLLQAAECWLQKEDI